MASIRLFGRGRNTAAASGSAAVGAAAIADVLEGLTAASMSTTWRCRHSAGVSIGEGAVDFAARRSRSTVIRGKYAFEYVRSGSEVYRAPVTDEDAPDGGARPLAAVGVGVDGAVADDDEDVDEPELLDPDEVDADESEPLEEEDGDEGEDEGVEGALIADEAEEEAEDGDESGEEESASASGSVVSGSVWERFSEHDACGVHAYAEPAVLAAGVRASGVVQPREAQEFDGVLLSAYSVTLKPKPGDPNRVLARLARQLRDHGANVVVVTAFVDPSAQDEDGEEPRIVRLRVELPHWTPADDPTADHSVSVELFEFDEPVKIEVPESATRRTARSCADLGLF